METAFSDPKSNILATCHTAFLKLPQTAQPLPPPSPPFIPHSLPPTLPFPVSLFLPTSLYLSYPLESLITFHGVWVAYKTIFWNYREYTQFTHHSSDPVKRTSLWSSPEAPTAATSWGLSKSSGSTSSNQISFALYNNQTTISYGKWYGSGMWLKMTEPQKLQPTITIITFIIIQQAMKIVHFNWSRGVCD